MERHVIELGGAGGDSPKDYLWSLERHGLEVGTGGRGTYDAHAHRHFVDLIYSPGGLSTPRVADIALLVVPPRVRFGPTTTDEFFFVKFLPSRSPHSIPDKVVGEELEAYPEHARACGHTAPWNITYGYYAPSEDRVFDLACELTTDGLTLESSAGWRFFVRRSSATAHVESGHG